MSPVHHAAVVARRVLARRPWLYPVLVVGLAVAIAAGVHDRMRDLERARAAWGEDRTVLVVVESVEPGMPVPVERVGVPVAIVPDGAIGALDELVGAVARQRIGRGEIVTAIDVVPGDGPMALVPDGWLAVPVAEARPSGAEVGDRVRVVSDGFEIADAMVVGRLGDVVLLGVHADDGPTVAATDADAGVTLLRLP